jgi:Spy/CpxP family protein refolding chaperone
MSGVNALFTPSDFPNAVNAALQLSDEQELQLGAVVAKSGEAQSRLNKELQAIWNDRGLSVEEGKTKGSPLTEELGRLRCRQLADAMAVLTPEQREKFEQMKGPKFAGLAAAPAPARRNPGARRVNWRMGLMEFKTVQKDLKLTGNQQAKLHDLVAKAGVVGELMSYVGPYERDQMQAELDKTAEGILSPEQTARINEICVQILGADALSDPAVVQAFGVTEKQKEALKTITPRSKENSERRPMEKTRIAEAIAVLTPLQREQFEKMKGPKFDISGLRAERAQ